MVSPVCALSGSEIQAGLDANAGGTYTLPAGNHKISVQLIVPEGTTFQGETSDSGELLSSLILGSNFCLDIQEPIVRLNSGSTVAYINFDGNSHNRDAVPFWKGHNGKGASKKWGQGYDNFIGCTNVENVRVHHCNFYNNLGDSFRIFTSKNIEFDHNTASKGGHDVFFAVRSEGVRVHDNYIQPRINSAIRLMDVSHARVYSNIIKYVPQYDGIPYDAGPSLQFQNDKGPMTDVEICDNIVVDSKGPGTWLVGKKEGGQEIWMHHNVFINSGSNHGIFWVGGIIASGYDGALIENNVFDGSYLGAINFYAVNSAWAKKATAELKANILCNAVPGTYNGKGGYGVYNTISAQKVISSQNCFWDNAGGDISGTVTSTENIFENPKKVETPSGFTWENGEWTCPDVIPSEMGAIEGVYDNIEPITQEEIDSFEFDNIFDIMSMDFVSQASENDTVILPVGTPKSPSTSSWTVEQHESKGKPYTLVYGPTEGLSEVQFKVGDDETTHTLMLGEKQGNSIIFNNASKWDGEIPHSGDALFLDGVIEPEDVEIVCVAPTSEFSPSKEVKMYDETPMNLFDPFLFVVVALLAPWILLGYFVLTRYFNLR